jgi:NAD+---dinitrogen-reductase ADP-D-ribosyltransferase
MPSGINEAAAAPAGRNPTKQVALATNPTRLGEDAAPASRAIQARPLLASVHCVAQELAFNLCNLPPWAIADVHFNDSPQRIEIQGVRHDNRRLFEKLEKIGDAAERAHVFHDYLSVKFQLHHWAEEESKAAQASIKSSYLRYLRGWGVDSSSIEGAVLKGWVESRIGLRPTFHKQRIDGPRSEAYMAYLADRMNGSTRTNAIFSQLDLVFAFAQDELARRLPGERWLTLYRGVNDVGPQELLAREGKRRLVVRLNNLCSFTRDPERAWEFGTTVWRAQVPLARVFFFSGLFPTSLLKGEEEHLVIGGEFRVDEIKG